MLPRHCYLHRSFYYTQVILLLSEIPIKFTGKYNVHKTTAAKIAKVKSVTIMKI